MDTRSTLNARQWQLFDEHAVAWLDELGLAANEGVFHRGLVEEVNVPFERFQAVHELLERDAVVRALRILGRRDGASPGRDGCRLLLEWPGMRLVRALDLSENYLGPWGVEMLAQAPSLAQLERLDLTRNIVWEGVESLARSPWLANLISLELADNGIADRRVRALARTRQLTALRELGLSNNSLTSAPELTESAPLRSLRMLDLRKNPLDEESRALLLRRFGKRVRL